MFLVSTAAIGLILTLAPADALTARAIIEKTHEAAGGAAWRRAVTNVMRGHATLYRNGNIAESVEADEYVMYRVYPLEVPAAHQGTGQFRLDARVKGQVLFQTSFDGERSYDQNGLVPPERAKSDEANAFGYSAIRFALEPGFKLERLANDEVEGLPCYFVKVTDPSGAATLFGIDMKEFLVRQAAWSAPKGWHHRIYTEYYRLKSGFMQPGRVRLYYNGAKEVDIRWTSAAIGEPILPETFVLGRKTP